MQETRLTLSPEVKYLGLIFDPKHNWKANPAARARMACAAYCCSRAVGSRWSWIYSTVIEPNLLTNNITSDSLTRSECLQPFALLVLCVPPPQWPCLQCLTDFLLCFSLRSRLSLLRLDLMPCLIGTLYSLVTPLFHRSIQWPL